MNISQALFSFQGRMRRFDYWLKGFPVLLLAGMINAGIVSVGVHGMFAWLSMLVGIICIWISLAILVKRLHDRNRSGWLVITLFIPLVNIMTVIWILIEVWFLKGTTGNNRYGNDPIP